MDIYFKIDINQSYVKMRTKKEGKEQGKRNELTGGGLKRSSGGWFEVLALKRQKCEMASDARILGRGEFVEEIRCNCIVHK